jgi:hypothetical protein
MTMMISEVQIMGGGNFTEAEYRSYARSTGHESLSRTELFKQRSLHRDLDPCHFLLREACDGMDHDATTPVLLGLDVTGSMGFIAEEIAKVSLVKLMTSLLETGIITDPQLAFMGIGDIHCDTAPVQISQFESDIRILGELRKLFLEGRGGGNRSESYDMAWYMAAYRTKLDCWARGEKGFLFTFGDEEAPFQPNTRNELLRVFGSALSGDVGGKRQVLAENALEDVTPTQLLKAAQRHYHVFHIIVEQGNYYQSEPRAVQKSWRQLMGKYALRMRDTDNLTEIVTTAIKLTKGVSMAEILETTENPSMIRYAFQTESTTFVD